MLFFIHRVDRPGTTELRKRTRPAHLAWSETLGPRLVFAGPTLSDDGATMTGSVWVIEAESREDADRITRADPFEQAGLFESKTIHRFMQVVPSP